MEKSKFKMTLRIQVYIIVIMLKFSFYEIWMHTVIIKNAINDQISIFLIVVKGSCIIDKEFNNYCKYKIIKYNKFI